MANDESGSREGGQERVDRENAPTERSAGFGRGDREATLPTQNLDDLDAAAADAAELADDRDNALLRAIAAAPSRRPPSAVAPGSHWGAHDRYVIKNRLGRGGMGTVYEATCTVLHRPVALKVLDVGEPDAAHAERMVREARVAANLGHARIAHVYDFGVHDGFPFVAMELVPGGTLRQWMTKSARPLPQILDVVTQIAEGLAELHGKGVVHRDLKPENVMRTAQGGIKLVDFGLARNTGAMAASHLPLAGNRPIAEGTSTAASSGTPGYMAPEQCTGKPIDARADIFALGVILYELIAQDKPFRGTTIGAIVDATLEGVPIPTDGPWAGVPDRLRAHVARMLAPTPADRFADGAAALDALRELAAEAAKLAGPTRQSGAISRAPTERPVRPPAIVDVGQVGRGLELPVALTGVAVLALAAFLPTKSDPTVVAPAGMALIHGGTYQVGRNAHELEAECRAIGPNCDRKYLYVEVPRVEVELPAFFLDQNEVTFAEFADLLNQFRGVVRVVDDSDEHYPRFVRFGPALDGDLLYDLHAEQGGLLYADHKFGVRPGFESKPAVQMTWFGAQRYCELRGKRLPTENEWEAAARGSSDRRFPWGDDLPRCHEVMLGVDGWIPKRPRCNAAEVAQPVGTMIQDVTPEGVHDLGGNVAEWTASVFVEGNRAAHPLSPPREAARVIRGGAWAASLLARTSGRSWSAPMTVGPDLGFRCASDTENALPR